MALRAYWRDDGDDDDDVLRIILIILLNNSKFMTAVIQMSMKNVFSCVPGCV